GALGGGKEGPGEAVMAGEDGEGAAHDLAGRKGDAPPDHEEESRGAKPARDGHGARGSYWGAGGGSIGPSPRPAPRRCGRRRPPAMRARPCPPPPPCS